MSLQKSNVSEGGIPEITVSGDENGVKVPPVLNSEVSSEADLPAFAMQSEPPVLKTDTETDPSEGPDGVLVPPVLNTDTETDPSEGPDGVLVPPVLNADTETEMPEESDGVLVPPVLNTDTETDPSEGPDGVLVPPVLNTEAEAETAEEPDGILVPPVLNAEAEGSEEASPESEQEEEIILPPEPEESHPFYGRSDAMTWWGFSQQGESHIRNGIPCQDRCRVAVSEGEKPVIAAAIADGVGSCALSHYGAAIAVDTSVSFLKEKLDDHEGDLEDQWVGNCLREAMTLAQESVAEAAEEMEQLEYSFQSTLTLAVYDGRTLYIGHAGDDGIVALTEDGRVEMVTTRIKGEEASSVYPLQAGPEMWQVIKVDRCVQGFVMATDGVLDAFVRPSREDNRVYYPFIQPAFETRQESEALLKETLDFYNDYMAGESYRRTVTDDLTMVVVTNQELLSSGTMPVFDVNQWAADTKAYSEKAYAALYPEKAAEKAGDSSESDETASADKVAEPAQEADMSKAAGESTASDRNTETAESETVEEAAAAEPAETAENSAESDEAEVTVEESTASDRNTELAESEPAKEHAASHRNAETAAAEPAESVEQSDMSEKAEADPSEPAEAEEPEEVRDTSEIPESGSRLSSILTPVLLLAGGALVLAVIMKFHS